MTDNSRTSTRGASGGETSSLLPIDPVTLAADLIRCPSVTPEDAGALDCLQNALESLGFACTRLVFRDDDADPIDNLYARLGKGGENFCFAGHTDVVPVGDLAAWTVDPFAAEQINGYLYGRGAVDMKSAIACWVAAVASFLEAKGESFDGSISLLITGDEEGPAINGTRKVLDWLAARREKLDACLVGEPTNPRTLGEMIKIGRRGSLSGELTVIGVQGHVAYPHLADNPVNHLVRMVNGLIDDPVDHGNDHFQPSSLVFTSIDVDNPASNVIPARATAKFNIRFCTEHTPESLELWLRERLDQEGAVYELKMSLSGDAFLTPPGRLSRIIADAAMNVTGEEPVLSTSGGTSDARFIKNYCPVAEFGLTGQTMHKVDERVAIADIYRLTEIYRQVLDRFFRKAA